jgi:hypothetical protein
MIECRPPRISITRRYVGGTASIFVKKRRVENRNLERSISTENPRIIH